ncbi:MAG: hypothetical protein ABW123_27010 [Cystobacter sp.]
MRKVCVLYEDQRGPTRGFGLHELVKACVRDVLEEDSRSEVDEALKDCRPLKGTPKLLKACREDIDLIANDGRSVIAVFDNDRIRGDLKLPRTAPDERVIQSIRGERGDKRLHVVLLKQNMESVIKAVRRCDVSLAPARLDAALGKDLLERDALLMTLAADLKRPIRDCVLGEMPSLRELVALLRREISPRPKARGKSTPSGKRSRAKAR